jgi:hypothetical protein
MSMPPPMSTSSSSSFSAGAAASSVAAAAVVYSFDVIDAYKVYMYDYVQRTYASEHTETFNEVALGKLIRFAANKCNLQC